MQIKDIPFKIIKEKCRKYTKNIDQELSEAFIWGNTKERFIYWSEFNIRTILGKYSRKYIKEYIK